MQKTGKFTIAVILVIAASVLTGIFFYILHVRLSCYHYDTEADYNYDFSRSDSTIIDLKLKSGIFELPNGFQGEGYTAFLKLRMETTLSGYFFQPYARLVNGKKFITDYFENGGKGIRYINISPITQEFGTAGDSAKVSSQKRDYIVKIKSSLVRFPDQKIELILMRDINLEEKKIVILSPHPDDAEIAAFGLYCSNSSSYIFTITAGDAGTYNYDELYRNRKEHFLEKGRIRTWNSISVPLLAGISPERVLNLGFFDGTLTKMFSRRQDKVRALYTGISNINTFRKQNISPLSDMLDGESDWNSLVNNLSRLLKHIQPDIIISPYPALDRHPDHKLTSVALFEAIKKAEITKGYLLLYTNHFILNDNYPYGRSGAVISLPPSFSGRVYFDSIFSYTLSADTQREKVISLDAMNDLRPDTSWRFSEDMMKMAMNSLKKDILGLNVSFYRRAVRNNELFFVVNISSLYNKAIMSSIDEVLPQD